MTGSQWDNLLKKSPRTCAKALPGILASAATTAQIASSFITACSKVDVEALTKENEELKNKFLMEEKRRKDAAKFASGLEAEKKKLEKSLDEAIKEKEKVDLEWSKIESDLIEERNRNKDHVEEIAKLKSVIDKLQRKHREELDEVQEASLQQGKDAGFDEGASSLLYTTWLHFPNTKCPDFFFDPYGKMGEQVLSQFIENTDCVSERVEVQQAYDNPSSVLVDPSVNIEPIPEKVAENSSVDQVPSLPSDQAQS